MRPFLNNFVFPLWLHKTTLRVPRSHNSDSRLVLSELLSMRRRHGIIASNQHAVGRPMTEAFEQLWIGEASQTDLGNCLCVAAATLEFGRNPLVEALINDEEPWHAEGRLCRFS